MVILTKVAILAGLICSGCCSAEGPMSISPMPTRPALLIPATMPLHPSLVGVWLSEANDTWYLFGFTPEGLWYENRIPKDPRGDFGREYGWINEDGGVYILHRAGACSIFDRFQDVTEHEMLLVQLVDGESATLLRQTPVQVNALSRCLPKDFGGWLPSIKDLIRETELKDPAPRADWVWHQPEN